MIYELSLPNQCKVCQYVWRKKGSAHDPKYMRLWVENSRGSVMAWACTAASGAGALIFNNDVAHHGNICSTVFFLPTNRVTC